ncbi:hypothetical protein [Geminocystis sp. GBBB08]|uniref:hypothetical protein n=1 Tax=Geminocystis sp. GBBB08 TaxID=2604140 RepID=UPI0027E22025|nr:hypothetical protein [Geminocystis sp. GBBB08]MBL1210079.1 hypothetical protein [Geminocystis sp. GBBB08]
MLILSWCKKKMVGCASPYSSSAHRFIYNSSTGGLFFDSDGNGIIGAVQIATLSTGLTLTNTSIFVES